MKNVAALHSQICFGFSLYLAVRQSQINHKLAGKVGDLAGRDADVFFFQLHGNFFGVLTAQEQCLADMDQHIVAELRAFGHKATKLLRAKDTIASGAEEFCFPGNELSNDKSGKLSRDAEFTER